MGHNISGAPIERISVFKESELLEKLLEKIRFFLPQTQGSENKNDITMIPSHIAVITDYDTTSELVKKHLKANGINCGSVEEQVQDATLVAVESSLHTMSYEWPIVIIVAKYCIDVDVSFFLRAASRSIAQLVVIERDYMAVQRDLDDILQQHDFSQLPFVRFQELVKEARSNKYDEDTLELDIAFAIFRSDYLPLSIRNSCYFGKRLHNTNLKRRWWWWWVMWPKIFFIIWLSRESFFIRILKLHDLYKERTLVRHEL
uniref:Uncharacterized protein n=1 Tax=Plectus sambesii TaxID=2011161 RepID=A0A914WYV2_9BILA